MFVVPLTDLPSLSDMSSTGFLEFTVRIRGRMAGQSNGRAWKNRNSSFPNYSLTIMQEIN